MYLALEMEYLTWTNTEDDRVVTGSSVPDFTYSFGLNLDYKGIGLNVFFQGVSGISTYPTHNLVYPYANGAGVTYEWLKRAWTPENTGGGFPRLLTTNSQHDNYTKSSTFWLRDASYLRLKNIQLSYDFPQKWIAPLKIASLKVFVNAENLLTFSDFDIFDPERSLTSDYIWSYPSVNILQVESCYILNYANYEENINWICFLSFYNKLFSRHDSHKPVCRR